MTFYRQLINPVNFHQIPYVSADISILSRILYLKSRIDIHTRIWISLPSNKKLKLNVNISDGDKENSNCMFK